MIRAAQHRGRTGIKLVFPFAHLGCGISCVSVAGQQLAISLFLLWVLREICTKQKAIGRFNVRSSPTPVKISKLM